MNSSLWIAIYLPLFIIFVIILPQQNALRKIVVKKKKGGRKTMANEVIKKYIGYKCNISTGTFGASLVGKIVDVKENWIEVETKKGVELINAEFVQTIKIVE